jgi:hypothetical protein
MTYASGLGTWIPTTSNADICAIKGMESEGKLTPVNPGYNMSIGFKNPPGGTTANGGFPISGGSGIFNGMAGDTGDVFDIYCLLNSFQTPQFGRINQIAPSIAWAPQAGMYSAGVSGGAGANQAKTLGYTTVGRQFSNPAEPVAGAGSRSALVINAGSSTDDNRASWAGHEFGGGPGGSNYPLGYNIDYGGYAFWPVEGAAGAALDSKLSFGSGSNTYLSCDGFTQKGFFRMSRDLTNRSPTT